MVGTAAMGDVTMVLQPGAAAPILLPTCQTLSSPQCQGRVINQCHIFSFPSHWKTCTSPCTATEVGRTEGEGKVPESIGLKLHMPNTGFESYSPPNLFKTQPVMTVLPQQQEWAGEAGDGQ